jgi:hypothetical protein
VNDPPPVVAKDDHGVEQPKRRGRNNEHVDGRGLAHVTGGDDDNGNGQVFTNFVIDNNWFADLVFPPWRRCCSRLCGRSRSQGT